MAHYIVRKLDKLKKINKKEYSLYALFRSINTCIDLYTQEVVQIDSLFFFLNHKILCGNSTDMNLAVTIHILLIKIHIFKCSLIKLYMLNKIHIQIINILLVSKFVYFCNYMS